MDPIVTLQGDNVMDPIAVLQGDNVMVPIAVLQGDTKKPQRNGWGNKAMDPIVTL